MMLLPCSALTFYPQEALFIGPLSKTKIQYICFIPLPFRIILENSHQQHVLTIPFGYTTLERDALGDNLL